MQIIELLSKIMTDVGGVGKGERNQHQNFNFRGIDTVTNAVSPALKKHGVIVTPSVIESHYSTVEVGAKRTLQGHARVVVAYTFYAPDGSNIKATVAAEAMDSGDKATAKAMSVAFRIALLQALCLPTDEPDPDHDSYVRSPRPVSVDQVQRFIKACADKGLDHDQIADAAGVDLAAVTDEDMARLRAAFNEAVK